MKTEVHNQTTVFHRYQFKAQELSKISKITIPVSLPVGVKLIHEELVERWTPLWENPFSYFRWTRLPNLTNTSRIHIKEVQEIIKAVVDGDPRMPLTTRPLLSSSWHNILIKS